MSIRRICVVLFVAIMTLGFTCAYGETANTETDEAVFGKHVLVVNAGNEETLWVEALKHALTSPQVVEYINNAYGIDGEVPVSNEEFDYSQLSGKTIYVSVLPITEERTDRDTGITSYWLRDNDFYMSVWGIVEEILSEHKIMLNIFQCADINDGGMMVSFGRSDVIFFDTAEEINTYNQENNAQLVGVMSLLKPELELE